MAAYRKKPVVIEAEVYREGLEDGFEEYRSDADPFIPIPKELEPVAFDWVLPQPGGGEWVARLPYIQTLEGRLYIRRGDWIIVGVEKERYPCKPSVFEAMYEPAEPRYAEDF
jgi:hypothetical protein